MKALCNLFVLMLASFALASCGGGGGGSNSAFSGSPSFDIAISASPTSVTTNSFTTLTVTVKVPGGSNAPDGTAVTASLTPTTIGTVSGASAAGATATNTVTGGTTTFLFNSSNQTGTAHIAVTASSSTASINVNVTAGSTQDPRLQLVATSNSLPLNTLPYDPANKICPAIFLGSPYVSEVTVTWRHSNGQLVTGTSTVNVSTTPTSVIGFTTLNTTSSSGGGSATNPCTDQFHTILGSGPVNVTGGAGTIYVVSGSVAGTGVLSVTAIDPDTQQTISSQLQITVAGGASGLPASVTASSTGGAYVQTSGGISALVNAEVTDGSGNVVADPGSYDNVQFTLAGPAGTDARLSAVNAGGQTVTGTTVSAVTHNGIASATFLPGNQQGPVQVQATIDRADGNVDNGLQDPASASATVVVSDGKLYRLTITAPDASQVAATGTSDTVTSSNNGTTYDLPVTVSGVDRLLNPALPGTVIAFGGVDSPQAAKAGASPQSWFLNSGSTGDPQEGGTLFTATNGLFTTAGGGAGPGDTLLVFGKQNSSPNNNDDLESARIVQSVASATSLNVTAPFNRNDTVTGSIVNSGPVLPYVIGRASLGSISSPVSMTEVDANGNFTGRATTNLHYPTSAIGKAVAIWAQGNGTDNVTGGSDTVADIATLVYPGAGPGALTASPDPLLGNASVPVTVCYSDAHNQPIPGFTLSFSFSLPAGASGSVDSVSTSGNVDKVTGSNGCVTVTVTTSGLPATSSSGGPTLTFTAGPTSAASTAPSVMLNFIVNISAMQVSPCSVNADSTTGNFTGTVTVKVLSSGGGGVSGQSVAAACTVSAGTATITPGSATTGSNGSATFNLTLGGVIPPATGSCLFTGPNNLQAKLVINGQCSNNGFSPPGP